MVSNLYAFAVLAEYCAKARVRCARFKREWPKSGYDNAKKDRIEAAAASKTLLSSNVHQSVDSPPDASGPWRWHAYSVVSQSSCIRKQTLRTIS